MTEADAVEAIFERWATSWGALQPSIPFALDNEAFVGVDKFARVTIVHSTAQQLSLGPPGSRRFERRGNITVQLFAPIDQGRKTLSLLVADVRTTFESQAIASPSGGDPLITFAASTHELAQDDRWYGLAVAIAFVYYERR